MVSFVDEPTPNKGWGSSSLFGGGQDAMDHSAKELGEISSDNEATIFAGGRSGCSDGNMHANSDRRDDDAKGYGDNQSASDAAEKAKSRDPNVHERDARAHSTSFFGAVKAKAAVAKKSAGSYIGAASDNGSAEEEDFDAGSDLENEAEPNSNGISGKAKALARKASESSIGKKIVAAKEKAKVRALEAKDRAKEAKRLALLPPEPPRDDTPPKPDPLMTWDAIMALATQDGTWAAAVFEAQTAENYETTETWNPSKTSVNWFFRKMHWKTKSTLMAITNLENKISNLRNKFGEDIFAMREADQKSKVLRRFKDAKTAVDLARNQWRQKELKYASLIRERDVYRHKIDIRVLQRAIGQDMYTALNRGDLEGANRIFTELDAKVDELRGLMRRKRAQSYVLKDEMKLKNDGTKTVKDITGDDQSGGFYGQLRQAQEQAVEELKSKTRKAQRLAQSAKYEAYIASLKAKEEAKKRGETLDEHDFSGIASNGLKKAKTLFRRAESMSKLTTKKALATFRLPAKEVRKLSKRFSLPTGVNVPTGLSLPAANFQRGIKAKRDGVQGEQGDKAWTDDEGEVEFDENPQKVELVTVDAFRPLGFSYNEECVITSVDLYGQGDALRIKLGSRIVAVGSSRDCSGTGSLVPVTSGTSVTAALKEFTDLGCYRVTFLLELDCDFVSDPGEHPLSVPCPEGHPLTSYVIQSEFSVHCDSCQVNFSQRETFYGCRSCDFDLCQDCYLYLESGGSNEDPPAATPPPSSDTFSKVNIAILPRLGPLGHSGFLGYYQISADDSPTRLEENRQGMMRQAQALFDSGEAAELGSTPRLVVGMRVPLPVRIELRGVGKALEGQVFIAERWEKETQK